MLATSAPKGLLICRDELAGWIEGMTAYNEAGRAFWIEAYGGRPYRVERQKHPEPIVIPRLAVAVYGGTQPDKLAMLMREADDGLLGRILWAWPEPIQFRLANAVPGAQWAIAALDRLRELDLQSGDPPRPIMVPLTPQAREVIEEFGREMQDRQSTAGGLLRSAFGKARGAALRLGLVLELLWWCGEDGIGTATECHFRARIRSSSTSSRRLFHADGRAGLRRCRRYSRGPERRDACPMDYARAGQRGVPSPSAAGRSIAGFADRR